MTTADERRGALDAVERLVNRGEGDVVRATIRVLEGLYGVGTVTTEAGTLRVEGSAEDDRPFLDRIETLVSAHLRGP